jgi:hypothetical protein
MDTIKVPNVGLHRLFAIPTTEPNGMVAPVHDKAMPVMLMTAENVGTLEEALNLNSARRYARASQKRLRAADAAPAAEARQGAEHREMVADDLEVPEVRRANVLWTRRTAS